MGEQRVQHFGTMVTATDTLKTGFTLTGNRQYTITKVLGQGGFGITYKAASEFRDGNISHEAYYAIKEFYPQEICSRQPDGSVECKAEPFKDQFKSQKEEFCREAKLLRDVCKHKNIVSVNEVIEANGTVYYVMQCINGDTLTQFTKQNTGANSSNIAAIIAAIGDGLEFLHSHKIAHLDIKPDNIILPPTGVPTIIDFGLARHYNKRDKLTHHHAFIGCSDGYSPIEQYLGIETFSPKIDTYALAATMLFMLTGTQPPKAPGLKAEYIHAQLDNKCPDNIINALIAATNNDISQRCDLSHFLSCIKPATTGSQFETSYTKIIQTTKAPGSGMSMLRRVTPFTVIILLAIIVLYIGSKVIKHLPANTGAEGNGIDTTLINKVDSPTVPVITPDPDPVPNPVPDPQPVVNRPYTWTGSYVSGKPDGEGTMVFKRDHTFGSYHFKAGDKFVGWFSEGKVYTGDWYDASGNLKESGIGEGM